MSILVGKKAPNFTAPAVLADGQIVDNFNLSETIKGKYAVVFFYPLDFTFVCPSEIIAMSNRMEQFRSMGVEVIGISIDSHFTHNAWRNTPVEEGGIGAVEYTLAGDMNHAIAQAYGIESEGGDSYYPAGVAMRASFVIDQKGIVRSQIVNDEPIGRNMDELVRIVDALQFFEENGQVCPAGWNKGDKGMVNTPDGVASYLKDSSESL
ncbi:peroxiredoxin [Marinomonas mediterranea]|jgi:Peroxiredoxin|uniref:Thioredoxin peroxidase n=1 Tax=Marinomonas mediterranea (strain ATCC 700492 / JCM 21426 / NBRC 103028 / MMB-1) TaxID=717774 RepID=F2K1I1_MARM1|nr:peroxiredoxin [Marinomonas mediterranea]ADZ92211.1 Peroxiredoxin [Marinomonas mediterranea MMB-1]WCN10171.1 redoxin domain-containing protein [Marinomonas mediterranea]WCN14216.1 redoxin domain-containing protein [Marinomonas mediterranea]WCN18272.1 redoxin domain-containing protein [Marinomonas mediterranea MMB-1]